MSISDAKTQICFHSRIKQLKDFLVQLLRANTVSSRYCPPILSRTRWDNVMEENYNFGRGDLDAPPSSPLHCSTSTLRRTPPPPLPQKCWTNRHILSPHQISGSVRGRITARRGISSRISSGWIPAGAPAPTAGLVLPPSQLWLCGCIVRAQPHPHPPIHTRDQHYPGPRPGQQSWLFWSCQHKQARKKKNVFPSTRRLLRLKKQQRWLDSIFFSFGGWRVREEEDNTNHWLVIRTQTNLTSELMTTAQLYRQPTFPIPPDPSWDGFENIIRDGGSTAL